MLGTLRQARFLATHKLRRFQPTYRIQEEEAANLESAVSGAFGVNPERSIDGIVRVLTPEQRSQLLHALRAREELEKGPVSPLDLETGGRAEGLHTNGREPPPVDLSRVDTSRIAPNLGTLLKLGVATGIPFIGFGFLDNFIMIVAGESLELHFGVAFGLSTMAAAGYGNILSDIAGLGLADQIEVQARKVRFGRPPDLTQTQNQLLRSRVARVAGSAVGVTIGGLLGMVPLMWD